MLPNWSRTVGEKDEISIKQVADSIVKAVGFEGDYSVRLRLPVVPRWNSPLRLAQFDTSRADGQYKKVRRVRSSLRSRPLMSTHRPHRMKS